MKKKTMLKTAVSVCLLAVISYYSFWNFVYDGHAQVFKTIFTSEDRHQKIVADKVNTASQKPADHYDSQVKKTKVNVQAKPHGLTLKPVYEGSMPANKWDNFYFYFQIQRLPFVYKQASFDIFTCFYRIAHK